MKSSNKKNKTKQNILESKENSSNKIDETTKNNAQNQEKINSSVKNDNLKAKEDVVFKNSKSNKKNISKDQKITTPKTENKTNHNTEGSSSKEGISQLQKNKNTNKSASTCEKNGHKIKIITAIVIILIILAILLIFSTIFALVHATKETMANGVSINNIDVSNLSYNDAKEKLEKYFDSSLDINIELNYEDFSYIIAKDDINLSYDLETALDEAYAVGRSKGIFQNNYELLLTSINKKNINAKFVYDEEALSTIVQYVETNIPDLVVQYSYYIENDNLIITPGIDGIKVDDTNFKKQIDETIQNRDITLSKEEKNSLSIEIPYEEAKADTIDIEKIYSEIYCEPKDAYYVEATNENPFEIYEDEDGIDFAISLEEANKIVQDNLEQYTIPLKITKASVTIDDIGIDAFPYQVSTFSTTYDASNIDRSTNLRIAAEKINGTVLLPGEQFSFNTVVGERTISEGYQDAKIYDNGQVVDGLAGGICQISSTLYNAVLLANLQIDERYNHSFTTSYIKAGRDATVVYGVKDLKFTNTRDYPIKIEASVENGIATFNIYGIKQENEYEVKIIPTTTETTPYSTQTISDSSLTPGTTIITQSGANGCKVTTRKEIYLNGALISNDIISEDTYQPMTEIIKVGK